MNNKYCKRINFIFINRILILINISRAFRLIHFDLFRTGNLHIESQNFIKTNVDGLESCQGLFTVDCPRLPDADMIANSVPFWTK